MNPQSSIKEFARLLQREYFANADDLTARQIVMGLMSDLLSEKYPLLARYGDLAPVRKLQRIRSYYSTVDELIEMDSITAAYQLSSFYSLLICQDRRNLDGIYFTPPILSKRLIGEVAAAYEGDISTARIIDPCSGGGAFLAPLTEYLRSHMKSNGLGPNCRLQKITSNLFGVDICGTLNELANIFCLIELYSDIALGHSMPGLQISTGDFLESTLGDQSYDIVIGNPPFRRISAAEQKVYKPSFSETRNGGSNLYGLFIQKSLPLVRPGGVVGMILPASLLAGARFARLRSYIGDHADVISVQTMQEREGVFWDVQQETAMLTLKKIRPGIRRRKLSKVISGCDMARPIQIGKFELPRDGNPWIIPRNLGQVDVTSLFSRNLPNLEDYGLDIRTGSVVWNRDIRPRYSHTTRQSHLSRQRYPLVWSDCIGSDGSFDFGRAKNRAPKEVFVGTEISDPELLRSSAIAIKRTSNSNQTRRIYCALIDNSFVSRYGAYLGENHVNLLIPKNGECAINMEVLTQVLNSDLVDDVYRCLSGSSSVSKYELSKLPLPDLECVQKRVEDGFDIEEAVRIAFCEQ